MGRCWGCRLSGLPPTIWAGGGAVSTHGRSLSWGTAYMEVSKQSSGCSCPVIHLHPCPLACCWGVIFDEECAIHSDSGRLQGLCYRQEAESWACRWVNIALLLRAARWGYGLFLLLGLLRAPSSPAASQHQVASLCPGMVALGRVPALLLAPPTTFCMQPLSPGSRNARRRAGRVGTECLLPSHSMPRHPQPRSHHCPASPIFYLPQALCTRLSILLVAARGGSAGEGT